jgi:hypothetical protein
MLKSLTLEDEGMQELINPVPLELVIDEDAELDAGLDLDFELDKMIASEDMAIRDVLDMLEDTVLILDSAEVKERSS